MISETELYANAVVELVGEYIELARFLRDNPEARGPADASTISAMCEEVIQLANAASTMRGAYKDALAAIHVFGEHLLALSTNGIPENQAGALDRIDELNNAYGRLLTTLEG